MSTRRDRSLVGTVFAVVGFLWFALHATEYVFARYSKLDALISLPEPLGIGNLFEALPLWASATLTATLWLGLLGAFLLLLRDRASVLVLALAMISAVVSGAWAVMASLNLASAQITHPDAVFYIASQGLVVTGLWLYARTAKRYQSL